MHTGVWREPSPEGIAYARSNIHHPAAPLNAMARRAFSIKLDVFNTGDYLGASAEESGDENSGL